MTLRQFFVKWGEVVIRHVRRMAYIPPILRETLREQYIVNT